LWPNTHSSSELLREAAATRLAVVRKLNAAHRVAAAHGAKRDVNAGQVFKQVLPVRRRIALGRVAWL